MIKSIIAATISMVVCSSFSSAFAESEAMKKISDMSIEELMDVKIAVASNKPRTVNRSAGIVSLITSDDIAHMGARDLLDILMQVPGFSIGLDTIGIVGSGFRGFWAYEGKMLILIDNQTMNENLFTDTAMARRFPVNLIDRIEIIRGPGSVKYGGYAELAVINIVTKLAAQSASSVSLAVGRQEQGSSENHFDAMVFKKGENVSGGVLGSHTGAVQGERDYTDSAGSKYSFKANSDILDNFYEAQINWGQFSGQIIYNKYVLKDQGSFGTNYSAPVDMSITSLAANVDYTFILSPKLTIRPFFNIKRDDPYNVDDPLVIAEQPFARFHRTVKRYTYGLHAHYDASERSNWLFGYEETDDTGNDHISKPFLRSGKLEVNYHGFAVFAETNYDLGWGEITAGVRHDEKSHYDSVTVPRFALVREYLSWGYKLLLSQAYRSPGVENIEDGPASGLKGETTNIAEVEINGKLGSASVMALNLYTMSIKNPIIYNYSLADTYKNFDTAGSEGVELSYQFRDLGNSLKAAYSFSQPKGSAPTYFDVPGHSNSFLGFENWKATILGTYKVGSKPYYISPALTVLGSRYGYAYSSTAGALAIKKFDEVYLANIVLQKKEFFYKNVDLTLGIYNLLDQNFPIIQAYNGGHAPIPSASREVMAKLSAYF